MYANFLGVEWTRSPLVDLLQYLVPSRMKRCRRSGMAVGKEKVIVTFLVSCWKRKIDIASRRSTSS